jgi:hypothetical protein
VLELIEELEEKDQQEYDPPNYFDTGAMTMNTGQNFFLPRINKKGHCYQKKFYVAGDE